MAQLRFLLDEHIPRAVADGLLRRGIEVLTIQDAGRTGLPDRDQLEYAAREGFVLVSSDSDFLVMLSRCEPNVGLVHVLSGGEMSIGRIIARLVSLHGLVSGEEMRDRVEFV